MNIGTGKDYEDYVVDGKQVEYHLIDIAPAGYKYNVYEFQRDFRAVWANLQAQNKQAIVCGGTGMYVESIVKGYNLVEVPEDTEFRKKCEALEFEQIIKELQQIKNLHNVSDIDTKKRAIRALEIAKYEQIHNVSKTEYKKDYNPLVIGVDVSRETRRQRIDSRLEKRIKEGLIPEVEQLVKQGVSHETLQYYGLEYKFASQYLLGEFTIEEFTENLRIAIHRFAKRQMTWFRGMERRGIEIHWIDGEQPMEKRVEDVVSIISSNL